MDNVLAISHAVTVGAMDTIENMAVNIRRKLLGRKHTSVAPLTGKVRKAPAREPVA